MAFTQEQIDQLFTAKKVPFGDWYVNLDALKQNKNFTPIVDYLTGRSRSLPNMQFDDYGYYWVRLLNLIEDLENLTANDQLVLDVMMNPGLFEGLKFSFFNWLYTYVIGHPQKGKLEAVVNQFRKIGMSDEQITGYFIFCVSHQTHLHIDLEGTALKDYLATNILHSRQLPNAVDATLGTREASWSFDYFRFLDETRPEFAKKYVVDCIQSSAWPVTFFEYYKDGYYLPSADILLMHNKVLAKVQTGERMYGIMLLHEILPEQYKGLLREVAVEYLRGFLDNHLYPEYEPGLTVQRLFKRKLISIPYSSYAIKVLLELDPNKGLELLSEFLGENKFLHIKTISVIQHHLGSGALPYVENAIQKAGKINRHRELIGFLQSRFEAQEFLPVMWRLADNKSKLLRELVSKAIFEKDPLAEEKAIQLLGSKNSDARHTAALVLTQCTSATAHAATREMLNKETNDNARDILLQALAESLPRQADENFIGEMILSAKERGKLKKPVEAWLDENSLPPLYDHSGKQLPNDHVRFLLYRMSRVKDMRSDMEARYIIQRVDKEKAADFAFDLIKAFIAKNGKAEYKYLMALAALLGDNSVVDKIRILINKWIEDSRKTMAEYGIGALALQGGDKALRWVEWYSRKYKTKKANVGAAALAALEAAAEEQGITTHELGDRIVPDFGFDGLFKHFSVNGEEYRAFIDSNFKIAFFNESNKKIKSIPVAADKEIKDEFKEIAKEVRDIVRSQSSRLEYYLIVQRKWTYAQWEKFFLQNPVMFIYAIKFLWGIYDRQGKLVQTFICNEDTTLLDVNNDEISIDPENLIGIMHPTQLDSETMQQWKKQFFDLSIEPIFPQLERKMPDMNDIDLSKAIITKFNGKQTAKESIRTTLERFGWYKGPTGDNARIESFKLLHSEGGMEAVLEVDGVLVGYGWGDDEKTGRLYVVNKAKLGTNYFGYPQNDDDQRLVKLQDVPSIFLSEMLAAVESIKPREKQETL